MEELIGRFGYLALSIGTFFEGETALLMASSLSSEGAYRFYYVIVFGFLGSFISDWLYFLIGRLNGKYFIDRRPLLKSKIEPVSIFFEKRKVQVLISYRFLYGFRIIIPVIIGMTNIRPLQFLFYSTVAGLVWATVVSAIGYAIGFYFNLDQQFFGQHLWIMIAFFASFGFCIGFVVNKIATARIIRVSHL